MRINADQNHSLEDVESVISAATQRADVSDLQEALRLAWKLFTPEQRKAFLADEGLIERAALGGFTVPGPIMLTAWHVTPAETLSKIKVAGLIPQIGKRSTALGESRPAIYLFPTLLDLEDALTNWLGDQFEEEEALALLKVGVPLDAEFWTNVDWELSIGTPIPANMITVLTRDLNSVPYLMAEFGTEDAPTSVQKKKLAYVTAVRANDMDLAKDLAEELQHEDSTLAALHEQQIRSGNVQPSP